MSSTPLCHMCMISYVWCMISSTDSARFKCCPGLSKCSSRQVQMQPYLNQIQALLVPYVCLSVLASTRVAMVYFSISGISQNALASPPPLHHPHRPCRHTPLPTVPRSMQIDFGARSYHSTSLRLMYSDYCASSTFFKTLIMALACTSARPAAHLRPLRCTGQLQSGRQGSRPSTWKSWQQRAQCRKGPSDRRRSRVVNGTSQDLHLINQAVQLRHTPPRTKVVKHVPNTGLRKAVVGTCAARPGEQRKFWTVCCVEAVDPRW